MGTPVECRVLGPLEVCHEDRRVNLGGPRPRAVLAALLLDAGRVVSTGHLAEAVWGERLPTSVRAQVSIHVSALRRAFGQAGCVDDVIETAPGGYRVRVDAVWLDADEVGRRADEGRRAAACGDADEAAEAFGAALALWRGPVLAEFDSPTIAAGAARLEELRLAVAEEWADAELATNRHREIVGELRSLVSAHPLRERVRAQLMRALAGAGRPSDALQTYRDGRAVLVGELGLEPGSELRDVQRAILTGDLAAEGPVSEPPGERPAPEPPMPAPTVPTELPGDTATFTGREDETERVCRELTSGARAVAIAGPGGVGKSTLAIHAAHRVAELFPDGRLYVDLHGATPDAERLEPGDVLARFLRSLGVPTSRIPTGEDEICGLFRSVSYPLRLLVVLDNAADAAQVRRLLPGGPNCAVLVTSRRMLGSLDSVLHLHLGVLSESDALALLGRLVGAERLRAEHDPALDVVRLCGLLPLALAIAGARLAARPDWSFRSLADRLAVEQRRLSELTTDDLGVRASVMVSYADLDEAGTAPLFRRLGLLDGPDVGVPVAAALTGTSDGHAEALLDALVDAQLAESTRPGRYRLHDLLRLFAREQAAERLTPQQRADATRRAVHCYLGTALAAAHVVAPSYAWRTELAPVALAHPGVRLSSADEVSAWVEAERENLLVAARQAATGDRPELAIALAGALDVPLEYRGRWHDQLTLGEIALDAARRTGDPGHHGLAHNDLGWAHRSLGHLPAALHHLEQALPMWRSVGHGPGEAITLHGIGVVCRSMQHYDRALASLEQASELAHRLGDSGREATCRSATGLTYQSLGRYREAIAAHEAGVRLAHETGSWRTEVMALGNLAEALRLAGEPERAAARFEDALAVDRAGDYAGTYWEAEHLWGLGRALHDLGRDGRECWRQSAAILHDLALIGPDERRAIEQSPAPATPAVIAEQL